MKRGLSEEKLEEVVNMLELCALALKFYLSTREFKYIIELESAVNRLHAVFPRKEKV